MQWLKQDNYRACIIVGHMPKYVDDSHLFFNHGVRFSLLLRARAFVENTHSCVVIVFVARQIV